MGRAWLAGWMLVLATVLGAQAVPSPALLPGEGLAVAGPDGVIHGYGDARRESPMGGLATLLWMRLEGDEWAAMGVEFKCKGEWNGHRCPSPKGHGRVGLGKALRLGCDLAFLAWIQLSADRWIRHYGEGVARYRLDEVFGPFLGKRLQGREGLPELGPLWIGKGDLLRTSPEDFLAWVLDPRQEETMTRSRRSFQGFVGGLAHPEAWWVKTAAAPAAGAPGETQSWVLGSNGMVTALLRVSPGMAQDKAMGRFQTLMSIPVKAK